MEVGKSTPVTQPTPAAPAQPAGGSSAPAPSPRPSQGQTGAGKDNRALGGNSKMSAIGLPGNTAGQAPQSKQEAADKATDQAAEDLKKAVEANDMPKAQEAADKLRDLQRLSELQQQAAHDAPNQPELAKEIGKLREQAADPKTTPDQRKELIRKAEAIGAMAKQVGEADRAISSGMQ